MAKISRRRIACHCGHEGAVTHTDADKPFSAWDRYELEGFAGQTTTVNEPREMPKDILVALEPTCPECGQSSWVQFID